MVACSTKSLHLIWSFGQCVVLDKILAGFIRRRCPIISFFGTLFFFIFVLLLVGWSWRDLAIWLPLHLPLLYGGQQVIRAIYLMIHSSEQFFICNLVSVGSTKLTYDVSHLYRLDPSSESC